jgi:hypothetical protein
MDQAVFACDLTSALWRVVEGAKGRNANVAHQRAVSPQAA